MRMNGEYNIPSGSLVLFAMSFLFGIFKEENNTGWSLAKDCCVLFVSSEEDA
jgi:hypothetical protein